MPIFDQGYQHWNGELSGHTWRWLAITRHGVRTGAKNRILRIAMIVAWLPAIALVVFLCLWGLLERQSSTVASFIQVMSAFLSPGVVADPVHYRVDIWRLAYGYFLVAELRISMVLILLIGPSLISQDLRFNALPLYFARPLRRIDYFLGKLGIIVAFLAMVIIVPSVIAYILGLLFSLDITILRDTFPILLASVFYGLIIAFSAGLLVLALSAMTRNSRYVALLWVGLWFVSGVTSAILQGIDSEQRRQVAFSELPYPRQDRQNTTQSRVERERQIQEWRRARERALNQYRLAELDHSKKDWRPLVSYTANLARLQQQLLHTDDTWRKLSRIQPDEMARDQLLATFMGPQYPWYWSAGILTALFGCSAWMLHRSVKSLDRLK